MSTAIEQHGLPSWGAGYRRWQKANPCRCLTEHGIVVHPVIGCPQHDALAPADIRAQAPDPDDAG